MRMRRQVISLHLLAAMLGLGAISSCATYESNLETGQRALEQSEHERALAIFRALEPDMSHLSLIGRAHYAYLRGMTDYRIGYKSEARHWLALASALEQKTPGSLPPDWEQRMSESLKELNEEVYAAGLGSLDEAAPAGGGAGAGEQGRPATGGDGDVEGAEPSP